MNSKIQSNKGIAAAIKWACDKNAIVMLPLSDSQAYDLCVDFGNGPKRVQVKTCISKEAIFELRTKGGNKSRETSHKIDSKKYDYLFLCSLETGKCWFIPGWDVDGTRSINCSPKYDEYLCVDA